MFNRLERKIRKALQHYQIPYATRNGGDERIMRQFELAGNRLNLTYTLDLPSKLLEADIRHDIASLLAQIDPNITLHCNIESNIRYHQSQIPNAHIKGVKNVIAVASGKGGVGKSTTAINLALALAEAGAQTGILDADIYGPSIAKMLGTEGTELSGENQKFNPIYKHGIYATSIAYMMDPDQALVWRGPMASKALKQLFNHTLWPELDYLIIDLPPGTGDIHLTLAQTIPVNGAVIVTTPQDIALIDAQKAIRLFEKVAIPVFGIIENMSMHTCSRCGHEEALFGEKGGIKLARDNKIPVLAQLPLSLKIRQHADAGDSLIASEPELGRHYLDAALQIAGLLSHQTINYASKMPSVNIATKD